MSGNSDKKNISFPNLIPYLFFEYRASALKALKDIFLKNLQACIEKEAEYCKIHKVAPAMTQDKIDQITSILSKITNVYELQALNDYVFIENVVPTYEEVKARGIRLKLMYPLLESQPKGGRYL